MKIDILVFPKWEEAFGIMNSLHSKLLLTFSLWQGRWKLPKGNLLSVVGLALTFSICIIHLGGGQEPVSYTFACHEHKSQKLNYPDGVN